MENLNPDTVLTAIEQHVFSELDKEIIILDLSSGIYYGLNEIGAFIWKLIQEPKSVNEVCNSISGEFDIDIETCREDLYSLINDLKKNKLIKINSFR